MGMLRTLLALFAPSEKDKEILESIRKLTTEYDVRIGPRGGISKTSKPEFVEKHRKELQDLIDATKHMIDK